MNKSHQEIIETQVDVAELAIGMHVTRLDRPWEETDFLIQGFVIKDQADIDALRAQCAFVFIEGRVQKTRAPQEAGSRNGQRSGLLGLFKRKSAPEPTPQTPPVPRKRVTYINKVDAGT